RRETPHERNGCLAGRSEFRLAATPAGVETRASGGGAGWINESVRDASSRGYPVQPAAKADERAGGPEDLLDAVQQPAPAAQRPGVGEVADRLFHQGTQPSLQAVVGP